MVTAIPTEQAITCPRCKARRLFINVTGATQYRCQGCEWLFTLTTQAPTGTSNASLAAGGTAIGVASGGASFTSGMVLLYDTGTSAEVLTVSANGSATSIPIIAAGKPHSSAVTFGQILMTPSSSGVGEQQVPNAGPWGF